MCESKQSAGGHLLRHWAFIFALVFVAANARAELEEVIVTASKREASTQTSAISISVISGEDLKERGVAEFFDFAPSVPNLSFGGATDGVLSSRSLAIRGVQGRNTTGVYIDDTPISENLDPRVLELKRIEVLRGPQGTLYGARSLGGTLRYISRKPDTTENYGGVTTDISTTNKASKPNYMVSGNYNFRLSDRAALLISGLYEYQEGVFDRAVGTIADHLMAPATFTAAGATSVNKDVDDRTTAAFSVSMLIQPVDSLTIEPRIIYQEAKIDGFPLADLETDNYDQNRDFDTAEGGEDKWTLYSLNVNYKAAFGTFTSATSRFERKVFEFEGSGSFINFLQALPASDGGFGLTPVRPVPSPIFQEQNFETTVQELRFVSDFSDHFDFVVGGFYQKTLDRQAFMPRNFATGLNRNFMDAGATVVEWPFGDLVFTSDSPTNITELGFFSEVTFSFSDRFALLLGARLFDTKVEISDQRAGLAVQVPLANDAPLTSIPAFTNRQDENGFNFKTSLEYSVTDDLFVYASIAEGFRLGGGNGPIPASLGCPDDLTTIGVDNADTGSYESDDLVSYEAGIKADLASTTRVNLTAFVIEVDNIQQVIQLPCGFQFVGNFGKAESKGIELEVFVQPTDNFSLGFNLGYTDAEFTETTGVASRGDPLQFVPKWTASAYADLTVPAMVKTLDFFLRMDISYVDDSVSRVNSISRRRDSYEQLGLRLGLRNEKFGITFYGRNLTDDIANLGDSRSLAAETPGRPRFVVSRPRTLGFQFSANF